MGSPPILASSISVDQRFGADLRQHLDAPLVSYWVTYKSTFLDYCLCRVEGDLPEMFVNELLLPRVLQRLSVAI